MKTLVLTALIALGLAGALERTSHADGSAAPIDAGVTLVIDAGSGAGSAAIAPAPLPLPDPLQDPGATLSLFEKLYKSGSLFCIGELAVFLLLGALEAKVPWLQQGYRKVVVTSLLGGLGVLSIPAAAGTTPNLPMLIAALGTAVAIAVKGAGSSSSS